jgi:hypothetical protein
MITIEVEPDQAIVIVNALRATADALASLPIRAGARPDYWTEQAMEHGRLADSILTRVSARTGRLSAEFVALLRTLQGAESVGARRDATTVTEYLKAKDEECAAQKARELEPGAMSGRFLHGRIAQTQTTEPEASQAQCADRWYV